MQSNTESSGERAGVAKEMFMRFVYLIIKTDSEKSNFTANNLSHSEDI